MELALLKTGGGVDTSELTATETTRKKIRAV